MRFPGISAFWIRCQYRLYPTRYKMYRLLELTQAFPLGYPGGIRRPLAREWFASISIEE